MDTNTFSTANTAEDNSIFHKLMTAIAEIRERRSMARQRFLAVEERMKDLSIQDTSYVNLQGISMPIFRA